MTVHTDDRRYGAKIEPDFSAWLLAQADRDGLIGALIQAAKQDRAFPRRGDAETVRARLRAIQADGEMFEAVDDAEADWRALLRG